jgi:hypothetical protein
VHFNMKFRLYRYILGILKIQLPCAILQTVFSCRYYAVADPKILKGEGGAPPEIATNSRILGLKILVLLTFDGKFRAKRGWAPL